MVIFRAKSRVQGGQWLFLLFSLCLRGDSKLTLGVNASVCGSLCLYVSHELVTCPW